MDAWMEGPLTSIAYGWRLERADGVTLGFTDHDRTLTFDGTDFDHPVPQAVGDAGGFGIQCDDAAHQGVRSPVRARRFSHATDALTPTLPPPNR